jgi:putative membrane protein
MKNLLKLSFMMSIALISMTSMAQTNTKKDAQNRNEEKFDDASDAKLLVNAYASGMAEVNLAEAVKSKTASDEIKNTSAMVITDHTDLNNQVRALASKKRISLPTQLSTAQQNEIDAITKYTGMEMDEAYIEQLIASHKKSEMLYEKGTKAEDAEIRAYFEKALPKIKQHLEMVTALKENMKTKDKEMKHDMNNMN